MVEEAAASKKPAFEQMNLFTDYAELERRQAEEKAALKRENRRASGSDHYLFSAG